MILCIVLYINTDNINPLLWIIRSDYCDRKCDLPRESALINMKIAPTCKKDGIFSESQNKLKQGQIQGNLPIMERNMVMGFQ